MHVGMNRSTGQNWGEFLRVPHARGDEPGAVALGRDDGMSSHARGDDRIGWVSLENSSSPCTWG